jgi:hypothetical protein
LLRTLNDLALQQAKTWAKFRRDSYAAFLTAAGEAAARELVEGNG